MKGKKKIIIIVSVVLVVALVALYLVPRIIVFKLIKDKDYQFQEYEYITEYDVMNEDVVEITNGNVTVKIPAECTSNKEIGENGSVMYYSEESRINVTLISPMDMSTDFTDKDYETDDKLYKYLGILGPEKVTKELGEESPNSYYNIVKCAFSLGEDDYSFFNLRQSYGYLLFGYVRNEAYGEEAGDVPRYIFENDNINAIVHKKAPDEDGSQRYTIDMFSKDDGNMVYGVYIVTNDESDLYTFLNSVTIN